MYNFNEIKSLSELKELCFYIKAIDESGIDPEPQNLSKIAKFLNKSYNLEISVSKLYLFVEKILRISNSSKFPKHKDVPALLNAYIEQVEKDLELAEHAVEKCELDLNEPKHNTKKSGFKSSYSLADDIMVKRSLFMKKNGSLLIWAGVIALFIVSVAYCIIGVKFPTLLSLYFSKTHEIMLVLLSLFVLSFVVYGILYAGNRKELNAWRSAITDYYQFEPVIRSDISKLNSAKRDFYSLQNKYSINGIQLSNEMLFNFLYNSDDIDIKYFRGNQKASTEKTLKSNVEAEPKISVGQVLSRYEQNREWREGALSRIEKECMNREIVARIDNLAEFLSSKGLSDIDLARAISDLYCEELSVMVRNDKIDNAQSKFELSKNYISIINKIMEFEKLNLFDNAKLTPKAKENLMVLKDERRSFAESIEYMLNRIQKACSLKLLTDGQIQSFSKLREDYEAGMFRGQEIKSINYRHDLVEMYITFYDQLSTYDMLN